MRVIFAGAWETKPGSDLIGNKWRLERKHFMADHNPLSKFLESVFQNSDLSGSLKGNTEHKLY